MIEWPSKPIDIDGGVITIEIDNSVTSQTITESTTMNNEHLVPVAVLDLIGQYRNAKPNSNEKGVLEKRLQVTLEAIRNELPVTNKR